MTNKLKLLTGIAVTAAVVVAPMAVSAATAPGTTTINAIIGSTISMTTTGTVNLNVTPVTGGAQTSASDGSPESNVASSSVKFAGVPALASPQLIKTTSSTAAADVTTVLYGVRADTSKPNGTYTDTVTYTATTK